MSGAGRGAGGEAGDVREAFARLVDGAPPCAVDVDALVARARRRARARRAGTLAATAATVGVLAAAAAPWPPWPRPLPPAGGTPAPQASGTGATTPVPARVWGDRATGVVRAALPGWRVEEVTGSHDGLDPASAEPTLLLAATDPGGTVRTLRVVVVRDARRSAPLVLAGFACPPGDDTASPGTAVPTTAVPTTAASPSAAASSAADPAGPDAGASPRPAASCGPVVAADRPSTRGGTTGRYRTVAFPAGFWPGATPDAARSPAFAAVYAAAGWSDGSATTVELQDVGPDGAPAAPAGLDPQRLVALALPPPWGS